ncbi:putative reverse transcriptase domain-containing protein [Tanacetum coccineum]
MNKLEYKSLGSLPSSISAYRLKELLRHLVDYSSLDHFSSDDSSSSSSSETSSDSPADTLSNSASSRSSSDHSLPTSPSGTSSSHRLCSLVPSVHHSSTIFERPSHDSSSVSCSRKRSRSPVASVPLSSPTLGALSYARANLLPSPKRIRSPETTIDLEDCSEDSFKPYVPREVGLGVDFEDESSEPSRSRGADLCFAYADALRDRGIDARVVVEAADREESETSTRGPVEVRVERVTHPVMPEDTPEPDQDGAVEVTYETLGDLIQRFHDHTEAIPVHRVQVIEETQREQGRRIVGAESAVTIFTKRVAELERDNKRLRGTVSIESQRVERLQRGMARGCLTHDLERQGAVNEQSDRRVAEALRVRDAVRNLGPLMGDEVEQEEVGGNGNGGNRYGGNGNGGNGDGGNGNGGNGNGNGNGGEYGYNFRGFMPARDALTWWNSHKRTIRNEAAYAMSWAEPMKLMTEVYCPRNKIQKIESELWNLTVKGNDLTVYTQRFQELIL